MQTSDLTEQAERFVVCHPQKDSIDLDELVNQTMKHLVKQYQCTWQNAYQFAAKAVAAIDSLGLDAFIDLPISTQHCLFLSVGGKQRAISLKSLVQLLEQQDEQA